MQACSGERTLLEGFNELLDENLSKSMFADWIGIGLQLQTKLPLPI